VKKSWIETCEFVGDRKIHDAPERAPSYYKHRATDINKYIPSRRTQKNTKREHVRIFGAGLRARVLCGNFQYLKAGYISRCDCVFFKFTADLALCEKIPVISGKKPCTHLEMSTCCKVSCTSLVLQQVQDHNLPKYVEFIFNATKAKALWQASADVICVISEKWAKKSKSVARRFGAKTEHTKTTTETGRSNLSCPHM